MTEAEWLACDESERMLQHLHHTASDRKLRLFLCACCRAVWPRLKYAPLRRGVETAEQYADGCASHECLNAIAGIVGKIWFAVEDDEFETNWTVFAAASVTALARPHGVPRELVNTAMTARGTGPAERSNILRDIFGNPFRPVSFDPEWRTSTAVALTQGMYESRDFSAMPILADALQDAGCEHADILSHCRDEKQDHARGCWVVDLVLGKD